MCDLAFRRSVIHSSAADWDHCGHLVTSGDPEAYWLSGDSGREWLRFDLGGVCKVSLIRIAWLACPAALEVQIPSAGGGWFTVRTLRPEPGEQTILPGELRTERLRRSCRGYRRGEGVARFLHRRRAGRRRGNREDNGRRSKGAHEDAGAGDVLGDE